LIETPVTAVSEPVEFYFDFSSPYSYLASERIEAMAGRYGRKVDFRPILLGVAFKATHQQVLVDVPLKGNYSRRDFARSARFAAVPFVMPETFPIATVGAARAFLWLKSGNRPQTLPFLHAAFRAYFAEGRNISETAVLSDVLRGVGVDVHEAQAAIALPAVKEQLKVLVDEALARGVFGAPFIFVDGEPFWGNDRLPQVDRWLAQGAF
jgi:2-hydroxychromene-2-carboxylate isomerase